MAKFVIVSCTALTEPAFHAQSALGKSLRLLAPWSERFVPDIAFENKTGIPAPYNRAIEKHLRQGTEFAVFVHDDVYLNDLFLFDKLEEGFHTFDVIGIAGADRLDLHKPRVDWCGCDRRHWAGGVIHPVVDRQDKEFYHVCYGPTPRPCVVVDGVFMAVRLSSLGAVRFDERFPFNLYDLDFCLGMRAAGRRIGVWPVLITHLSLGASFNSETFRTLERTFRMKHMGQEEPDPPPGWIERIANRIRGPKPEPKEGKGIFAVHS